METSEFIRPEQAPDALALTPVSSGVTCETFKYQRWNKWFLLKRLRPELRQDPSAIAAFEKEFDLGIRLDHPGIVRYFEKGTDAEGVFLVEEYIDGETLSDFAAHPDALPDPEVRRIFSELANAVDYLHGLGIVHADLKSDNIIITRQGHHPKIIDLGFSGQYSYTPVSPKDTDTGSDILALGRILESMAPGRFRKIVRKATEPRPEKRYRTAKDMAAALQERKGRWFIVPALPLLLAAASLSPFLKRTAETPVPQIVTVRDTLVIRDTIYTEPKPLPLTIQEQFRQAARKEAERQYAPFYASFDKVTQENMSRLMKEENHVFDALQNRLEQMASEWAQKHPDKQNDFISIAGEELERVGVRFSMALSKASQEQ